MVAERIEQGVTNSRNVIYSFAFFFYSFSVNRNESGLPAVYFKGDMNETAVIRRIIRQSDHYGDQG